MGGGSASIRPLPPRGRVRVPDVKCFEGESGKVEGMGGRGQQERREGRQEGASFGASGPLSRLGGPQSQLRTLGRL